MPNVLVLEHVPYEGEGCIADYLREHGMAFDVVRVWQPYVVPDIRRYSALIVMGGPMGAYDDFPSKSEEIALIKAAVGSMPVLGICLGSQLLAHALEARVYPNVREGKPAKEIGYDTVYLTADGAASPLFKGFETDVRVLQWHGDTFDLPNGATLLATSPVCRHQAFSYGNAFGILFHLELTPEIVQGLARVNHEWTHDHFDLDEDRLLSDARDLAPFMKAQCFRLLDNFFSAGRSC